MANLLSLERVSKSYGGVTALSRCDLEVREGQITGLIGPNGSGKTTMLNVISGLYPPQEGQILRGDRPDAMQGVHLPYSFRVWLLAGRDATSIRLSPPAALRMGISRSCGSITGRTISISSNPLVCSAPATSSPSASTKLR